MNPRINPQGQPLRDALLLLSDASDTLNRAEQMLSDMDLEVRLRFTDMPKARRLRESADAIIKLAERIRRLTSG